MAETKGLSARELLKGVYDTLKEDGEKEIELSSKAMAEIARDSDYHKERVGYMGYESAVLLKVGWQEWVVAFGTKCGAYPADPYDCDIVAVQFSSEGKTSEEIVSEAYIVLEGNHHFHNSLIYAMEGGLLAVNSNGHFGSRVLDLLKPEVQKSIVRDIEIDPSCCTMDMRPVVKSAIQYEPEFVAFVSDVFRMILGP